VATANVCLCCQHPKRTAIDAALAAGDSLRFLSSKFGIAKSSLHRHKTQHLLEAIAYEGPAAGPEVWGSLLERRIREQGERAERLFAEAEDIMRKARRRRDSRTALAAIKAAAATLAEIRNSLELNAKLAGQLKAGTTVNVAVLSAEAGGALTAKLERLIVGAQERLPAGEPEPAVIPETAPQTIEVEAELVPAEPVP